MDGQLSFFEQDRPSFSVYLNDFTVPGPLAYFPKTDTIISANSNMVLQAFKYVSYFSLLSFFFYLFIYIYICMTPCVNSPGDFLEPSTS